MAGCMYCDQDVTRRGRAAHTRAKHPAEYRPKPKYQSRVARLSTAMSSFDVGTLEATRDTIREALDAAEDSPTIANPLGVLDFPAPFEVSEVESLKDEMESWRDNMEEKLSHTMKYEDVSSAADALDTVVSAIEDYNSALEEAVNAFDPTTTEKDALEAVVDSLDEAISAAENAESEAGGVMFPGMY